MLIFAFVIFYFPASAFISSRNVPRQALGYLPWTLTESNSKNGHHHEFGGAIHHFYSAALRIGPGKWIWAKEKPPGSFLSRRLHLQSIPVLTLHRRLCTKKRRQRPLLGNPRHPRRVKHRPKSESSEDQFVKHRCGEASRKGAEKRKSEQLSPVENPCTKTK